MNTELAYPITRLLSVQSSQRVLLVVTHGRQRTDLTELITRLALHGPFWLIAGGDWLPDQDAVRRSVRRHTLAVRETLEHVILSRPFTCLQLRDQLLNAGALERRMLILDFLHHFYNPDVDRNLRERVLVECCTHLRRLSLTRSLIVLVQALSSEDYQRFLPILAAVADDVLEAEEVVSDTALQARLF